MVCGEGGYTHQTVKPHPASRICGRYRLLQQKEPANDPRTGLRQYYTPYGRFVHVMPSIVTSVLDNDFAPLCAGNFFAVPSSCVFHRFWAVASLLKLA